MKSIIFIVLFLGLFSAIQCSHNRGGFISWKVAPGTKQVTFSFTHAWRTGGSDSIGVYYGDGGYQSFAPSNKVFSGTDQAGEGYDVFTNTATHTYAGTGPYTVYWSSCCRVSTLVNAADQNFNVQTTVDLRGGYSSPIASVPPLLQFPISATASYQIGVADPNGLGFSCALATSTETAFSPLASVAGKYVSVTSDCVVHWDTAAATQGNKYAVGITISQAGTSTKIPLDFIIEMVPAMSLPTCAVSAPTSDPEIGKPWTATITGTSAQSGVTKLSVSVLNLASDATITPAAGSAGNIPLAVRLTVLATQAGAYSTSVVFKDSNNRQVACGVAYQVTKREVCAVTFRNCSVKAGKTNYVLSSTNQVDSFNWSSTCAGAFDSTTNSAVTFVASTSPSTACNITAVLTNNGNSYNCLVPVKCAKCSTTQSAPCRVDVSAVYTVSDPASIDAHNNGDLLAAASDADGSIVSATATNIPPGVGLAPNGSFYVTDKTKLDSLAYNVTVTTTDAFGGVTIQVITLIFLDVECGTGLVSCGFACYNPDVHTCFFFQGHRHLCAKNQLICNMADQCCYDPLQQDCINGSLCPKNYQKCNELCFNPNERSCLQISTGEKVLCITGQQICGDSCVDPNIWNCWGNSAMCLKSEQLCGSACYDPNVASCAGAVLVPKGYQVCGQSNYNPTEHVCLNGHTLCPLGMSVCGAACYYPTQLTCQADFSMCPFGNEQCGTACYDDSQYVCCDHSTNRMCLLNDPGCVC